MTDLTPRGGVTDFTPRGGVTKRVLLLMINANVVFYDCMIAHDLSLRIATGRQRFGHVAYHVHHSLRLRT